jgi:hypothetical protein
MIRRRCTLPVRAAPAEVKGNRWLPAPEAVAYDLSGEVVGGPAGAPESGSPA